MTTVLPFGLFGVTFFLQTKLGYDVAMFPLYMFSIAILSWTRGMLGGIFSVTVAIVLWYLGTVLTEHKFNYVWALHYNVLVRAVLFISTSYFIITFKRVVEQHRLRMEAMRALLNVCHGCGSMQGGDGKWLTFQQLESLTSRPLCECPSCEKMHTKP